MFLCFFVFMLARPLPGLAHELVPKRLEVWLETHQNATSEQIEEFFKDNLDIYNGNTHYRDKLIAAIKSPGHGRWHILPDFIKLGIAHVLSGIDHIFFIISLLLVFISIRETLKLTTTFTVAHSITLILAGAAIVSVPPRVTEPLIALSISYVALTSVFLKKYDLFRSMKNKVASVFFFGLFHGLGFASALKELYIPKENFLLSLLSFNVGVEIGQLCVIALAVPFIFLFRHKPWYPKAIAVIAAAIGAAGIVWGVQRIFS